MRPLTSTLIEAQVNHVLPLLLEYESMEDEDANLVPDYLCQTDFIDRLTTLFELDN